MLIAFDTETTGLDRVHGCRPFMVTAFDEHGQDYLWRWEVDPFKRKVKYNADDLYDIRQLIMDNTVFWHNAKFDVGMLAQIGCLDWDYFRTCDYHDTALMAHMFDNLEMSYKLKPLAKKYLAINDDDESLLKKATTAARTRAKKLNMAYAVPGTPTMPAQRTGHVGADYWLPRAVARHQGYEEGHLWYEVCENYALGDVVRTLLLGQFYYKALTDLNRMDHYEPRRALLPVVFDMEVRGVTVLPERMETLREEYQELSKDYERQAKKILHDEGWGSAALKLNIDSHNQMREILYDKDNFAITPTHFTKSNAPATHVEALMTIMDTPENEGPVHDFILSTLLHRKHDKAARDVESYIQFARRDILHCNIHISGTSTTRFSSSAPNTQNISKGENPLQEFLEKPLTMRYVFGPRPGRKWFAIDYRQLQLFIFAYITGERKLIDALEGGADAHDYVARQIFQTPDNESPTKGQRRIGKNVNFGFIFGASPWKIEQTAKRPGLWDVVTKLFPNAHTHINDIIGLVRTGGETKYEDGTIYVPFTDGYPLRVPHGAPYSGVNYQVQGLEGLIVQEAMRNVDAYLIEHDIDSFITLMIHDELVIDCPDDIDPSHVHDISQIMRDAGNRFGMKLQTSCDLITDNLGEGSEWPATTETDAT